MRSLRLPSRSRLAAIGRLVAVVLKLAVVAACLWYVARQIDLDVFVRIFPKIDLGWITLAVLTATLQIPLIGLRWLTVLDALPGRRVSRLEAIAITWISAFVGQVLPYASGDAMRVWLLSRLGSAWRLGLMSILIDRGVGVAMLFGYGFVILLMPSALMTHEDYRGVVLVVFGTIAVGVVLGLAGVPWVAPVLDRWRLSRWIGAVALACYDVLVKSRSGIAVAALALVVHTLTILCVWCIGRSLGIPLSPFDAAVLFVLILAVALIPISVGGWGLREVAVVALLASHGVPAEIALSLSVIFGLVFVVGSLPGAIIWAVYSPAQATAANVET